MLDKFLIPEEPLLVLPTLAKYLGINEAIVLQQIHYWLSKKLHYNDGRFWTYNTYQGWLNQFNWLSERGLRNIINKLEKMGLLESNNYNKIAFDQTKWYTINYAILASFTDVAQSARSMWHKVPDDVAQSASSDVAQSARPIPKNTKTSTKNNGDEIKSVVKEYFLDLLPIDSEQTFIEVWCEWVDFRVELKKKITRSTAKKQINFLINQTNPIECINQSIKNGWRGLFEVKNGNNREVHSHQYKQPAESKYNYK